MKQKSPNNTEMILELSIIFVFFFILLAPIIAVFNNHDSNSNQSKPVDTPTTQDSSPTNRPVDSGHDKSSTEPTPASPTTPAESDSPQSTSAQPTPTPSTAPTPTTPTCHHEEQGICWDELEDANYSAGLYDRENANYGATIDYPDSCDSVCRDIIDDAYEEGWYDGGY
jgi:cytoskeletal protein RodZ